MNDKLEVAKEKAKEIIKKFEGLRLKSYQCQANVWTIGYGNTSFLQDKQPKEGVTITLKVANELLDKDIEIFFNNVVSKFKDCNYFQIATLTSLCFNIGVNAFNKSTLCKVVLQNPNDYINIENEFLKWIFVNKKENEGLKKRRQQEFLIYKSGYDHETKKCSI